MGEKKDSEEKDYSLEEQACAREGFDVRANLEFLREYGANESYLGKIFARAVIDAREFFISRLDGDSSDKARKERLKNFQKRVRAYLSRAKVRLRFAPTKGKTIEEVLGEFDNADYVSLLKGMVNYDPGKLKGIENALFELLVKKVPFEEIAKQVIEGTRDYRKKRYPQEALFIEARCIQNSLESYLSSLGGGNPG